MTTSASTATPTDSSRTGGQRSLQSPPPAPPVGCGSSGSQTTLWSAAHTIRPRAATSSSGPSERSGTCATSSPLPWRCQDEDLGLRVLEHEAEAMRAEDFTFEAFAPAGRTAEERLRIHILRLARDEEAAAGIGRKLALDNVELLWSEIIGERRVLVLLDLVEPPWHVRGDGHLVRPLRRPPIEPVDRIDVGGAHLLETLVSVPRDVEGADEHDREQAGGGRRQPAPPRLPRWQQQAGEQHRRRGKHEQVDAQQDLAAIALQEDHEERRDGERQQREVARAPSHAPPGARARDAPDEEGKQQTGARHQLVRRVALHPLGRARADRAADPTERAEQVGEVARPVRDGEIAEVANDDHRHQ